VKDLEGRVVDLHDRRGKIAIVLFWATWCAPCMQELDALNRIYPRLRDRADVKAVNVDDKLEVVRELAKNHDLAFPIFTSEGSQVTLYTNAATIQDPNIPQLYVIDRAGSVRFHLTGFDDDGVFAQRLDWMLGAIK
jgi:peroxiredoxin